MPKTAIVSTSTLNGERSTLPAATHHKYRLHISAGLVRRRDPATTRGGWAPHHGRRSVACGGCTLWQIHATTAVTAATGVACRASRV
jgi:hypothetical protein